MLAMVRNAQPRPHPHAVLLRGVCRRKLTLSETSVRLRLSGYEFLMENYSLAVRSNQLAPFLHRFRSREVRSQSCLSIGSPTPRGPATALECPAKGRHLPEVSVIRHSGLRVPVKWFPPEVSQSLEARRLPTEGCLSESTHYSAGLWKGSCYQRGFLPALRTEWLWLALFPGSILRTWGPAPAPRSDEPAGCRAEPESASVAWASEPDSIGPGTVPSFRPLRFGRSKAHPRWSRECESSSAVWRGRGRCDAR